MSGKKDKTAKRRGARRVLSEAQEARVMDALAAGKTQGQIADKMGVSQPTISRIVARHAKAPRRNNGHRRGGR